MKKALNIARKKDIVLNSLKIALVVGTILNLINQGENFIHPDPISLGRMILTYCVPYFVSTYASVQTALHLKPCP